VRAAGADIEALCFELQTALLPRDQDDERNAFVEIRAGTGGDESALFAGDLARMYLRHCERRRWQTEVMSESLSDLGGYKEVVFRVSGDGVKNTADIEPDRLRVRRMAARNTAEARTSRIALNGWGGISAKACLMML